MATTFVVLAGLDPAIHAFAVLLNARYASVDARNKSGRDGVRLHMFRPEIRIVASKVYQNSPALS
jgi:hypothetical protein